MKEAKDYWLYRWKESQTLKERLLEQVDKNINKNKCWIWLGNPDKDGYGHIKVNNKRVRVHRLSYLLYKGIVPENMSVLHKCDNPPCVNPDHLWLGNALDNNRDRENKGRGYHPKGENHYLAKKSQEEIDKIRKRYISEDINQKQLAAETGLSQGQISRILTKTRWNNDNFEAYHRSGTAGEHNPKAKLTWGDVREIRKRYKVGEGIAQLARKYKMTYKAIENIIKNKSWYDADYTPVK